MRISTKKCLRNEWISTGLLSFFTKIKQTNNRKKQTKIKLKHDHAMWNYCKKMLENFSRYTNFMFWQFHPFFYWLCTFHFHPSLPYSVSLIEKREKILPHSIASYVEKHNNNKNWKKEIKCKRIKWLKCDQNMTEE